SELHSVRRLTNPDSLLARLPRRTLPMKLFVLTRSAAVVDAVRRRSRDGDIVTMIHCPGALESLRERVTVVVDAKGALPCCFLRIASWRRDGIPRDVLFHDRATGGRYPPAPGDVLAGLGETCGAARCQRLREPMTRSAWRNRKVLMALRGSDPRQQRFLECALQHRAEAYPEKLAALDMNVGMRQ